MDGFRSPEAASDQSVFYTPNPYQVVPLVSDAEYSLGQQNAAQALDASQARLSQETPQGLHQQTPQPSTQQSLYYSSIFYTPPVAQQRGMHGADATPSRDLRFPAKAPSELLSEELEALLGGLSGAHADECGEARTLLQLLGNAFAGNLIAEAPYAEILALLLARLKRVRQFDGLVAEERELARRCEAYAADIAGFSGGATSDEQPGVWGAPVPLPPGTPAGADPTTVVFPITCTRVSRVIVDTPLIHDGKTHPFVNYRIVLHSEADGAKYFRVRRRFNDLKGLYEGLKDETRARVKLPTLPPQKYYLFGGLTDAFIEERRQRMEEFLEALASVPELVATAAFQRFVLYRAEVRPASQGYN